MTTAVAERRGRGPGRPFVSTMTVEERFWARVSKSGPMWNGTPCWVWTGGKTHGYGEFHIGGKNFHAHRLAYEMLVGPIPSGLDLDHLCRNRACVHPMHLEPVTRQVNLLRGEGLPAIRARVTHCPAGHPYDLINTYNRPNGTRGCRTCRHTRQLARRIQ